MSEPTITTPTLETPAPPTPEPTLTARTAEIPPEPKPPIKPADEVREAAKLEPFWDRMMRKKEKKDDNAKPTETPKVDDAKPTEKEDKPAEDVEKAKPKLRKVKSDIDPLKLAEIQGREIGKSIAREMAPKADTPKADKLAAEMDADLIKRIPEEFQGDADTFSEMARRWPDKYGKLLKQMAEVPAKEEAYKKKWEGEHAGEEFNPDDPEHDSFYDGIEPKYDKRDFKTAERELIKQELRKEPDPEIEELRLERKMRTVQPEIEKAVLETLGDALGEIDKDSVPLAESFDKLKTLGDSNPIAAEILTEVAQAVLPVMQTNIKLHAGVEKWDAKNPSHVTIARVIDDAEQRLQRLPIEQRINDGKTFASQADYARMTPEEQAQHWYIGRDEINQILRYEAVRMTKERWAKEEKKAAYWTKRNGGKPPGASVESQTKPSTVLPKEEKKPETIPSPTITGRATISHDALEPNSKERTGLQTFWARLGVK